jgi:hypothetical protein
MAARGKEDDMPEGDGGAPQGPVEALRRELDAARTLLEAQKDLEAALRSGKTGEEFLRLIRRQDECTRAAQRAAAERRHFWLDAAGFEAWLRDQPEEEAQPARRLAEEAREVRDSLGRTARRSEYIARRSVEWTQAQLDLMVRWLTSDNTVYRQPGADRPLRETPSLMDRTA